MPDVVHLWERPTAKRIIMLVGWRQWADAGSVSSGLPEYWIEQLHARPIGQIKSDGYYLFQIPGTHDLVRPVVNFEGGYPVEMEERTNDIYYAEHNDDGFVIFLGDEPHLNATSYIDALLEVATTLKVIQIVAFAGVYGELPYNKERMISCVYSQQQLKAGLQELTVNFSDYKGGASIGAYMCHRAAEKDIPYAGFYAFVPTYDFTSISQIGNTIRIENDFMAWYNIMKRVNFWLKLQLDLTDLKRKSQRLVDVMDAKVDELQTMAPELGLRDFFSKLADEFDEAVFDALDDVWEDELRRLLDDNDTESNEG